MTNDGTGTSTDCAANGSTYSRITCNMTDNGT